MALSVGIDPALGNLLTALGLTDADGGVDDTWFSHPLEAVRRVLANPTQRAALLRLLESALPPEDHPLAPPGARWHPVLSSNDIGNVYVTVDGDTFGVALAAGTPPGNPPGVQVTVLLPIVEASGNDLDIIAATPAHPLDVSVVADLGPGQGPDRVGLRVAMDATGGVRARVRLEDTPDEPGGDRPVAELDPATLDLETLRAIELLLRSVLAGEDVTDDAGRIVLRLSRHLFALLGADDPAVPPLDLVRAVSQPGAVKDWLTRLVGSPAALRAWFGHWAGLVGAVAVGDHDPVVRGTGSPGSPLRTTLLDLGGTELEVTLAADGDLLTLGLALGVDAGRGRLAVGVDIVAVALGGTAPATVLPAAHVLLAVPVSADGLDQGTIVAGAGWNGTSVAPVLRLDRVVIGGIPHTLDLSSAEAVATTAVGLVGDLIRDALGRDGAGVHALALFGLDTPRRPDGAPVHGWPHLPGEALLSGDVLRAVAQYHRTVLADPAVSWGILFGDLAALLGVQTATVGTGSTADPWRLPLAADDGLSVELAAWDEAGPGMPGDLRKLRIGLRVVLAVQSWAASWTSELAGFDLPRDAAAGARFLGSHALGLTLDQPPRFGDVDGTWAQVDGVTGSVRWVVGRVPEPVLTVTGLAFGLGPYELPPVTLTLPPPGPGVDPAAPDLGLGLDPDVVPALLEALLAAAFDAAGAGSTARAVAGLLGLRPNASGLPRQWPDLLPADPSARAALLADPLGGLAAHVHRVATATDGAGEPLLAAAVPWLAALLSGQAPTGGVTPCAGARGAGSHDNPWTLPLTPGTAGARGPAVLLWQDPPPPVATAEVAVRSAGTADDLLDALAAASPPGVRDLLHGRVPSALAAGLDDLADLLADGDGLVSFAAATAVPPGWTFGPAVPCGHDRLPGHPDTVAQAAAALRGWGSGPVLLLSSATGGRRDWDQLIAVLEPGHDPDADLDLRGGDAARPARLAALTAVAMCYPVDLDDDGGGAIGQLADQVDAAVDRVLAATGAAKVRLAGHGAAGLAARVSSGRRPDVVAGVVTVGSPHAADPATAAAVTDPLTADAVRFAAALLGGPSPADAGPAPAGSDVTVAVLRLLAAVLDGGPARDGAHPPAAAHTAAGLGAIPGGAAAGGAGFAIGGRLPAPLVPVLAALAPAAEAEAGSTATHLSLGLRVPLALPTAEPGDAAADLVLRADVARLRLGPGPEPDRPARRVSARARLGRDQGWLVGGPGTDPAGRGGTRARWAEVGADLERTSAGSVLRPVLVLHDAAAAGNPAARLDLAGAVAAVAGRGPRVPLPAGLDGPAATAVLDVLRAAGLVVGAADAPALDTAAVAAVAAGPAAALAPRAAAVADALATATGGVALGSGWAVALPGGLELRLHTAPWQVTLSTAPDATVRVEGELTLRLPELTGTADAALVTGPARLSWDSASGALELSLPPWLPALSLRPGPVATPAAAAAVLQALPRMLLQGALTPLLGRVLGARLAAAPFDRLLADPLHWVTPFDAGTLDGMLAAVGAALGRPDTGGLALPAGLAVRATGDPVELRLSGTVDLGGGTQVLLDGGVRLRTDPGGLPIGADPLGTATLDVTLPGGWGGIAIEVGASPAGLVLAVTPRDGTAPTGRIELLPSFSGLGALAAAGERLLPQLLQELVTELRPPGPLVGPLGAALAVAAALGLWADDEQGFTAPDRVQRLTEMLRPEWWESLVTHPADLADALGEVLDRLPPPIGTVDSDSGVVTWTVPLPVLDGLLGGTVAAGLGWGATGPVLRLAARSLQLGPMVLDEATFGVDGGDLAGTLVAHLAVDGLLAPLRPQLRFGVDNGRFTLALLPLGDGSEADLLLAVLPEPAAVAGPHAARAVVQLWGVPLGLGVLLRLFGSADGDPLTTPLWGPPYTSSPGPSALDLLAAAGLVEPGSDPPAPALALPDPAAAVTRAAQRAASGVGITLVNTPETTLTLTLVSRTVPGGILTGVSLRGWARAASDDVVITVRFGDAPWLHDPDRGVVLWLLGPDPAGTLPAVPTLRLEAVGLGIDVTGTDGPLLEGTLTVGGIGALLFLTLDPFAPGKPWVTGLGAGVELRDAFVDLPTEDADSFLRKLLPNELAAPFDLTVVYRDGQLEVHGSNAAAPGRFELTLPLGLDLGGVVRISELLLALETAPLAALEAAISVSAGIGPIAALVRRVGVVAVFGGDRPGLRLRAPDQVGLSIDTSTLRLGGFVLVDEAHGRYVGAVEIALLGKFEITAVALITTRMPDGSEGFSLLFLISIVFPTPISLGYGFFFAGAGGLLGLNRSVDLDRLHSGLRASTADSILFPTDIVRRADVIVRDLEQVFPVAQGQFLIGPMAMITWGTPPLITLKLGIVLELGRPIRIAILGLLRAALPDAKDPVLDLKVAFLGTVDLATQLLAFDAAIYDSYIGRGDLKISIEGDIALRLSWSEHPDFVTSLGGFHPAYDVPTHLKLPAMRRITISLLKDNPRISLTAYLAVTANSVQFGSRVQLYVGVAGFSVEGDLGFDVLFQRAPFRFEAAIWARLAVKAGGATLLAVSLDFSLRGPAPWIARGTASFSILFFTVRVSIEQRFGEESLESLPKALLLPTLRVELERAENWSGELSPGATAGVTLLPLTTTEGEVVVDAGGALTIGQRTVPLGTTVTRFGTSEVDDVRRFEVPQIRFGSAPDPVATEPVTEPFSPDAFQVLSDEQRLRAPAFERRAAGARVTAGVRLRGRRAVVRTARFDVIVAHSDDPTDEVRTPHTPVPTGRFEALAAGGAAGRSASARRLREATAAPLLDIGEPVALFAVTRARDLRPLSAAGAPLDPAGTGPDGRPTWPDGALLVATDARDRLTALAAASGRGDRADLQVIPGSQLAAAGQE